MATAMMLSLHATLMPYWIDCNSSLVGQQHQIKRIGRFHEHASNVNDQLPSFDF